MTAILFEGHGGHGGHGGNYFALAHPPGQSSPWSSSADVPAGWDVGLRDEGLDGVLDGVLDNVVEYVVDSPVEHGTEMRPRTRVPALRPAGDSPPLP